MDKINDIHTAKHTIEKAIFQTIAYFDIFNFPLTISELHTYNSINISKEELLHYVQQLITSKQIQEERGYYFFSEKSNSCVDNRITNEKHLAQRLQKIQWYAKLVSKFPFVEAAFISGSVSKGILTKDGDVDYFIVAKANRIWLCRSLLVLFKKIFLLNSKKYFCINYFIDTNNLLIPDKNIFVATEVKSLQPIYDSALYNTFIQNNNWINEFFPNTTLQKQTLLQKPIHKPIISKLIEKVCQNSLGEKLDNFFFKTTLKVWQKKFAHFHKEEFDINMRSYKNVSKHHPQGFQYKVLEELKMRMTKFDK